MRRGWARGAFVVGLALIATALYGRHGWNGEDDGFLTGLAWRVVLGEWPYRDFIYIRPALSPVLHALTLLIFPEAGQVLCMRFLYFLALAASTFVTVAELDRAAGSAGPRVPVTAIALLGFAIASSGFPPMPWHTVDGVLLGACGLAAFSRARGVAGLALGALLVTAAAATKQSFFFLVPIGIAQVAWARGRRDAILAAVICGGLAAGTAGLLAGNGLLGECLRQITSATHAGSLLGAGAIAYLKPLGLYAVPAIAGVVALDRGLALARGRPIARAWIPYAVLGGVLTGSIVHVLIERRFVTPLVNYPGLLWLATGLALVVDRTLPRRAVALLGACLGLAWCASLSWGYQTPVLFAAPLVWGALWISTRWFGTNALRLTALVLPLALAVQGTSYLYPYRDAPRAELRHDLGEVFEKLRGLKSSEKSLQRLRELSRLKTVYGERFTVLPSLPAAHYLTGTRPVIAIDWPIEIETAGRTLEIERQLARSGGFVFLDREARAICEGTGACCVLAVHVRDRWERIERGLVFDVFRATPALAGAAERDGK